MRKLIEIVWVVVLFIPLHASEPCAGELHVIVNGSTACFEYRSSENYPPLTYSWDFDGDGDFDTTTTTPEICYVYEEADTYWAVVQVEDGAGCVGEDEEEVVVEKGFVFEKIVEWDLSGTGAYFWENPWHNTVFDTFGGELMVITRFNRTFVRMHLDGMIDTIFVLPDSLFCFDYRYGDFCYPEPIIFSDDMRSIGYYRNDSIWIYGWNGALRHIYTDTLLHRAAGYHVNSKGDAILARQIDVREFFESDSGLGAGMILTDDGERIFMRGGVYPVSSTRDNGFFVPFSHPTRPDTTMGPYHLRKYDNNGNLVFSRESRGAVISLSDCSSIEISAVPGPPWITMLDSLGNEIATIDSGPVVRFSPRGPLVEISPNSKFAAILVWDDLCVIGLDSLYLVDCLYFGDSDTGVGLICCNDSGFTLISLAPLDVQDILEKGRYGYYLREPITAVSELVPDYGLSLSLEDPTCEYFLVIESDGTYAVYKLLRR